MDFHGFTAFFFGTSDIYLEIPRYGGLNGMVLGDFEWNINGISLRKSHHFLGMSSNKQHIMVSPLWGFNGIMIIMKTDISIPWDLLSMEFIYHVKEDKRSTNSYIHGQSLLVHKKRPSVAGHLVIFHLLIYSQKKSQGWSTCLSSRFVMHMAVRPGSMMNSWWIRAWYGAIVEIELFQSQRAIFWYTVVSSVWYTLNPYL